MAEKKGDEKKQTDKEKKPSGGAAPAAATAVPMDTERALVFTQVDQARGAWKRATAAGYNMVGGTTVLTSIGEGFALSLNVVAIDTRPMKDGGDLYPISDERWGLGKAALFRLAGVAGLNWVADQSQRIDDGSVETYCHWRAVANMRDPFSGNVRWITAEKVIDLRPGSATFNLWRRQAQRKADGWNKPEQADDVFQKRLEEFLPHIASQCETKAQLRVVRSALGLLTAYPKATLQKPFVVPVLMLSPESIRDPVLRNRMIEERLKHAMGIGQQLYGQPIPMRTQVTAATPAVGIDMPARHAPPPVQVGGQPEEDDLDETGGDTPEPASNE